MKSSVQLNVKQLNKQQLYVYMYKLISDVQNYIHKQKIQTEEDQHYEAMINDVDYIIKRFIALYQRDSAEDQSIFVAANLDTLYKLYDVFFAQETKRVILNLKERDRIRGCLEQFYKRVCGINSIQYFLQFPTKIFDEFIKGITRFTSDHVYDRPTYHRSGSCGPKDKSHFSRYTIHADNTKAEKQQIRNELIKCIIEREVYDQIYERILHKQNPQHLHELESLKRLAFDYGDIIVKVHGSPLVPTRVSILVTTMNGIPQYREDYRKYKNGKVLGIRADNIAFRTIQQTRLKYKVQSFAKETEWSNTVPAHEQNAFDLLIRSSPNVSKLQTLKQSQPNPWRSKMYSSTSRKKEFTFGGN